MASQSTTDLIADLVADINVVAPLRVKHGILWVMAAMSFTVMAVIMMIGIRVDEAGTAHLVPLIIANGLLLILAVSAALTALAMATPYTGARRSAPKWALAMIAVLPVAAIVDIFVHGGESALWHDGHGLKCLLASLIASLPVMAALFAWVRQGAPAHPRLTAATIGTAGGAMGTIAYGLACPIGDVSHLFLWHIATPFVTTMVAAALFKRLLKW